ncbi:hypothetical protein NDU88_011781 [Pleurodeles waltl]|uniref:Uncharacterized protein n=1 Tax=Pleurodeles waltl TaxID=8319 RepID=A0AAV7R221_PLEWA|nr:hypothetical protein NDU88_011781 [Pleurodeles waltl]
MTARTANGQGQWVPAQRMDLQKESFKFRFERGIKPSTEKDDLCTRSTEENTRQQSTDEEMTPVLKKPHSTGTFQFQRYRVQTHNTFEDTYNQYEHWQSQEVSHFGFATAVR